MPNERELATLGPWSRGANNIAEETSVPPRSYRRGVNIDSYPSGKVRRRRGSTLVQAVTGGANSGWSDKRTALFRAGAALYRFNPGQAPINLAVVDAHNDLVYASVNQFIYVSDGNKAQLFSPFGNFVRPWGIKAPGGQPALSATPGGGLHAGAYQVAVTFATADGEESGTPVAGIVDVQQGGGIALSAIPQPFESHVSSINVFVSRANGTVLLHYSRVPVGTLTLNISNQRLGRKLTTQFLATLPAAQTSACYANGRMLIARENLLLWSEPLQPGLYDPRYNFAMFPYEIDLVVAAAPTAQASGYFVASGDKTYYLAGSDPRAWSGMMPKHHAGAIRGSACFVPGKSFNVNGIPDQELPVWATTAGGLCLGLPDGSIISLLDGKYAMDVGAAGSALFRELDGVRQVLLSLKPPTERMRVVASDSLDIIHVKNGLPV